MTQLENLPQLTSEQAAVVGAMLAPHNSLHDAALSLDIQLGRFFDLLASPAVQTHITHIRKSLDQRLRIRLAEAAHKAVDVLEYIAESDTPQGKRNVAHLDADSTSWQIERRRAATTILRAHAAPKTRRPRSINVKRLNDLVATLEQAEPPTSPPQPSPQDAQPSTKTPSAGGIGPGRAQPRTPDSDTTTPVNESARSTSQHSSEDAPTQGAHGHRAQRNRIRPP